MLLFSRVRHQTALPIGEDELEDVPAQSGIPMGLWMGESVGIDSILGGRAMPKAYSADFRGGLRQ